jgi:predicted DCC family thiol-disulfide oxidoreductase YuxK
LSAADGAESTSGHLSRERPVLLYDDDCRFCRWAARVVERLDTRQALALLPLQAQLAAPLLEAVPEAERLSALRLVEIDGRVASHGLASARVLELLEPLAPLGRAARRRRPAAAVGRLYALVSSHRTRLGGMVPDGPGPRRFP